MRVLKEASKELGFHPQLHIRTFKILQNFANFAILEQTLLCSCPDPNNTGAYTASDKPLRFS